MFQSSELGFETIRAAKEAGADATCDYVELIEQGLFPTATPATSSTYSSAV
jgi:hypothetical protein